MKIRTPDFIIQECERLIEVIRPEYKAEVEVMLERLRQRNKVGDAIRIIDSMAFLADNKACDVMLPELFHRSHISNALIDALKNYENQEEARNMLEAVKTMANCNSSWCQDDNKSMWEWDRTFRLVSFEREWNRICSRSKILPTQGSIKIAVEVKEPKKTKVAEKAYQEIPYNLSWISEELAYKIWFRLMKRVYYYIYVP